MIDWLKNEWLNLSLNYCDDRNLIDHFWIDIEKQYSKNSRYYHNLNHIYNMFLQLEEYKNEIIDLDILKFSIWYHDIIYKSTKKDNELKSAEVAENNLTLMGFDKTKNQLVKKLIISTKKHEIILNENNDNGFLLDLDLSILGSNWEVYKKYIKNIRKEYKVYPSFLYNPGRKKVLHHFLEREKLYFTEPFRLKYEKQARENLKREIQLL